MADYELIAPCHFGLEAVLKREIQKLGYDILKVEDGKVTFAGDEAAIVRANIFLRTTERILIKIGSFKATTFDELFEGTKALPWEQFIPEDGKFWVAKATSIKSKLFSPSDIQSIMKKAMVDRLKKKYNVNWFPEDGASFPLRVTIMKDVVTVGTGHFRRLPAQAGIPSGHGKSTDHRNSCGSPDHADPLEMEPYSGGSFLRKRYLPDRGCHDRSQYCSRYESFLFSRGLDPSDPQKGMV